MSSENNENQNKEKLNNTHLENKNVDIKETKEQEKEKEELITVGDFVKSIDKQILFDLKCQKSEEFNKCTYDKGYISQEIYFCETCFNENKKYSVICLGCCFNCHKDHEVQNLFFKRNMKCDCGNNNFNLNCCLKKDKDYENIDNIYNHNFEGKFCYCDKEDDGGEMFQCFFCEDWFHLDCTNIFQKKDEDDYGEFVCRDCLKKNSFIFENYLMNNFVFGFMKDEDNNNENNNNNKNNINLITGTEFAKKRKHNEIDVENDNNFNNDKCKLEENKFNYDENKSLLNKLIENKNELIISTKKLEKILCYCEKCQLLYKEKKLDFLNSKKFNTEWYQRVLFDDKINNEIENNPEENNQMLNQIQNIDIFKSNVIRSLDVEKQMQLSLISNEFIKEFSKYISDLKKEKENNNLELIITEKDVNDFLKKFQEHIHN